MLFGKISPELAYKKENLIRLLNSAGYPYSRAGIKKYQRDNNIPTTGQIDFVTAAYLDSIHDKSDNKISEKGRIYDYGGDKFKIGNGKDLIKDLPFLINPQFLKNLEEYTDNPENARNIYIYIDKNGSLYGFDEEKKEFYQL